MTTDKPKLIDGAIAPTLYKLAMPMFIGIAGITVFNLADAIFIARLGTNELAALSFTFPVVVLIGGLTMGIGLGVTAIISLEIGKGKFNEVRRLTRDGLILAMVIVVTVSALGLASINPVFRSLGVSDEIMPLVNDYMTIWYFGIAFLIIPMVGNSAIRGMGETKIPAMIMMFAAIVNIILDPLLIFGLGPFPQLGIKGAAIATVIARFTTLLLSLYVLVKREKLIDTMIPTLKELLNHWKSILAVGGPAGLVNILSPVAIGIITKLVSSHGPSAVAAFGAGARIEQLATMIPAALGAGITPFIGQNWGAKRIGRIQTAVKLSQKFLFLIGLAIYVLIFMFASQISVLFTSDLEVSSTLTLLLRIVMAGFCFDGPFIISATAFNALRLPRNAMILQLGRLFLLHVPFCYIGSMMWGLPGLFFGIAASKICSGVIGFIWSNRKMSSLNN